MKNIIISFTVFIFLLTLANEVSAQCGPAGLDPCIVTKIVRPATKAVVKKANTVKKAVVRETTKTAAKNSQSKTAPAKNRRGDKNSTSIYDSLSLKDKPATEREDILFPVNGVTIGETTERELIDLGGARNTFTDQSTGDQRVYYTINNLNYWLRDGVADSVGIYKFTDKFPTKWQLLGFDYKLSYDESVKLLKSLDYEVQQFPDLPKLEDIGKVNRMPRIIGTRKNGVKIRIAMSFLIEKGMSYNSPDTLMYMFVGTER